jgi:hypothetical protein
MRNLEIPQRTAFFAERGIGKAIRRQPAQPKYTTGDAAVVRDRRERPAYMAGEPKDAVQPTALRLWRSGEQNFQDANLNSAERPKPPNCARPTRGQKTGMLPPRP